ncbi:hypothetical protein J2T21_000633 [Paeniglutamicibacter psychrophenolicus]|nr:hypothetical protein [Paeniglutamicibacter psychrophenolicus]
MNTDPSLSRPIGCCLTAVAVSSCPTAGYCWYFRCCWYFFTAGTADGAGVAGTAYFCGRLKLSDGHALRLLHYCCGRLKLSRTTPFGYCWYFFTAGTAYCCGRPKLSDGRVRLCGFPQRKQLHLPRSGEAICSSSRMPKNIVVLPGKFKSSDFPGFSWGPLEGLGPRPGEFAGLQHGPVGIPGGAVEVASPWVSQGAGSGAGVPGMFGRPGGARDRIWIRWLHGEALSATPGDGPGSVTGRSPHPWGAGTAGGSDIGIRPRIARAAPWWAPAGLSPLCPDGREDAVPVWGNRPP